MRTLFDDDTPVSPTTRAQIKRIARKQALAEGDAVSVQLDVANSVITTLTGRVIQKRSDRVVIAVGGTILAFTLDGSRCLTDGFGPQTTIL